MTNTATLNTFNKYTNNYAKEKHELETKQNKTLLSKLHKIQAKQS